jgi:hypothetical protein
MGWICTNERLPLLAITKKGAAVVAAPFLLLSLTMLQYQEDLAWLEEEEVEAPANVQL